MNTIATYCNGKNITRSSAKECAREKNKKRKRKKRKACCKHASNVEQKYQITITSHRADVYICIRSERAAATNVAYSVWWRWWWWWRRCCCWHCCCCWCAPLRVGSGWCNAQNPIMYTCCQLVEIMSAHRRCCYHYLYILNAAEEIYWKSEIMIFWFNVRNSVKLKATKKIKIKSTTTSEAATIATTKKRRRTWTATTKQYCIHIHIKFVFL